MEPVGITNAWASVVVPNNRRMNVTDHSAMKPRAARWHLFCSHIYFTGYE